MADMAKDLVDAVRRAFTRNCKSDTVITGIERTLKKNGVSYREAEEYAARLGELLAQAYQETITPNMLPDGKLDEAMAEELLRSLLTQNYQQAAEVAARVQTSLNRAAGIGMKGLIPEQREDRLTGLIQKAASYDSYEKASWVLDEPVVNYTQSAVEDTIEKNAGAHYRSGLHPKIKRISVGGCCKWCNSLAGTHDYPVPREIYRRHERCRCLVLYDPGDGKIQDAHTKKVYENSLEKAKKEAAREREKHARETTDREHGLTAKQREARIEARIKDDTVMDLESGEEYKLVGMIQDKKVFAGKGTKNEYRKAWKYAERYGGDPEEWQHVKGIGTVETPDGQFTAEIHWSAIKGFDHVEMFIKEYLE